MNAQPTRNVSASRKVGPTTPTSEASPSVVMLTSISACVTRIIFLRGTMSEMAPEMRPKRSVGNVLAVCTSATIRAEGVKVAISHDEMVACIV